MLSPKDNYLKFQPTSSEELKAHREDQWLTVSLTYTLSEMVHLGATAEQLQGARTFIHVLQNMWDRGSPPLKLPVKSLETFE